MMENNPLDKQRKPVPGTSSEVLIGIFDRYSDAQRAIATMLNAGFPRQLIQIYPESEASMSSDVNRNAGFDRYGSDPALNSLLKDGKYLKPREFYVRAIRSGHYLVIVNAHTNDQVDQAAAIMNRFKSIWLEERPAEWEHQEWAGAHEHAGGNRTGMETPQSAAHAGHDQEDYLSHWQSTYGSAGGRYEDYDATYHYGSDMARRGHYNVQSDTLESQLRNDWESSHPGLAWEKVKDAVHYGAQRESMGRH